MKSRQKWSVIFTVILVAVAALAQWSEILAIKELQVLDGFRVPHRSHPDLVIAAIDNKSLETLGRWPWDRGVHAGFLEALKKYEPRVVGFDVTFSEPQDEQNDRAFVQALAEANFPVVLAREVVTGRLRQPMGLAEPLDMFKFSGGKVFVGHTNVGEDSDGVARKFPRAMTVGPEESLPFGMAVLEALNARVPDSNRDLLDFAGPAGSMPTYSYADIFNGVIDKELLRDKIVLVGATASSLQDYLLAPLDPSTLAGVEWHANVIGNSLQHKGLSTAPFWFRFSVLVLLGLCLHFSFSASRRQSAAAFSLAALLLLLPLASLAALRVFDTALPMLGNLGFVVFGFTGHTLYRWYATEEEKRELRRTVQNYFSPQVLAHVLKDPEMLKLGGQRREVTIFFSDIRSFTTITETTDPKVLSSLLHEYFTAMAEEILATDGVVDKFIGDAIMAFWGAPLAQDDQADRAMAAAIKMLKKLPALRDGWRQKDWPEVHIGIGIATGLATVGNMGSSQRFDYTVIGDSVNLAARLESATKEYGVPIVLSESTKDKVRGKYNFKFLGGATVKGKTQAVNIYTVDYS